MIKTERKRDGHRTREEEGWIWWKVEFTVKGSVDRGRGNCMRCGLEVEVYLVAPLCRDALRVYHTNPELAS